MKKHLLVVALVVGSISFVAHASDGGGVQTEQTTGGKEGGAGGKEGDAGDQSSAGGKDESWSAKFASLSMGALWELPSQTVGGWLIAYPRVGTPVLVLGTLLIVGRLVSAACNCGDSGDDDDEELDGRKNK